MLVNPLRCVAASALPQASETLVGTPCCLSVELVDFFWGVVAGALSLASETLLCYVVLFFDHGVHLIGH